MVQAFGINEKNDMYVGPDNNLVLLSGLTAIEKSACLTACRTQLGECVLQQGIGLPNFQLIWVGSPDYGIWQSYLQQTLLNISGVTAVNSITLSASNNRLSYVAEISTIYGPATLQG